MRSEGRQISLLIQFKKKPRSRWAVKKGSGIVTGKHVLDLKRCQIVETLVAFVPSSGNYTKSRDVMVTSYARLVKPYFVD